LRAPPLTPLATAVLRVDRDPERVLAIAADEGEAALFLAREFPAARVRGVDRSARRVRAAAARAGLDPEGRIAFKQGKPGSLPFPDAFFDLVAQLDGRPAPAELARVLRPGGYLVLTRPRRGGSLRLPGPAATSARLARHGFELLGEEQAGDGSFSVGRLRRADPPSRAD
jgi:SAM-dependent methyltransferase